MRKAFVAFGIIPFELHDKPHRDIQYIGQWPTSVNMDRDANRCVRFLY